MRSFVNSICIVLTALLTDSNEIWCQQFKILKIIFSKINYSFVDKKIGGEKTVLMQF